MYRHSIRRGEKIPFEENTQKGIKLDRNRLIKQINLELAGSVVLAGGSASGAVNTDSVMLIMPKIEIVANGMKVLFRQDAQTLYYKNQFEYGTPGAIAVPADGSAAAHSILCNMVINFMNNVGHNVSDTFLPAHRFKSLDLLISWGDLDDMFTAACDRTKTMSSAYGITPIIVETTEPEPKFIRVQDYIEDTITATSSDFQVELPVGAAIYQNLMFKTLDAGERDSDVINSITLETDSVTKHISNVPYDQYRNMNELNHGIDSLPAGFTYLPLTEEGRVTSGLNLGDVNQCKLHLDVTVGAGTTKLRTYMDKLVPLSSII